MKPGLGQGNAWAWHQDYPPWHKIDGMPRPHCIMASVFIDDCTPVTSPLLVLPGSQHHGLLEADVDAERRGTYLPSSEIGTPRQLRGLCSDAMATLRQLGCKYMFFITATTDKVDWVEIPSRLAHVDPTNSRKPKQDVYDRASLHGCPRTACTSAARMMRRRQQRA